MTPVAAMEAAATNLGEPGHVSVPLQWHSPRASTVLCAETGTLRVVDRTHSAGDGARPGFGRSGGTPAGPRGDGDGEIKALPNPHEELIEAIRWAIRSRRRTEPLGRCWRRCAAGKRTFSAALGRYAPMNPKGST